METTNKYKKLVNSYPGVDEYCQPSTGTLLEYMKKLTLFIMEDFSKLENKSSLSENKVLISFLKDLIFQLGINIALDYDGLESEENIILYQNIIKKRIKKLQSNMHNK